MTTLDVPGARLYYETHGEGTLLLLIGSPMDSTGFAPLVPAMADEYTVVIYDPRGIGNSTREDDDADITPEQLARMDDTNSVFFGHLIRQTTSLRPDLAALHAAPTRIVVGVGETSKGQLAHRTGVAFAEAFGVEPIEFPGDHGGFMSHSEPFSRVLKRVLAEPE